MEDEEPLCKICLINAFLKNNFYILSENKKDVKWTNLEHRNAKVFLCN